MGSKVQKCIWMEAGAVDYQLCPLNLNCDQCDFYVEMTSGNHPAHHNQASKLINLGLPRITELDFLAGLQYLRGHLWYKHIGAGLIQLGIDRFLWQLFSSPRKITTPAAGAKLADEQCLTWLQFDEVIVYIKAPFPSQIVQVNQLFQAPDLAGLQAPLVPLDELWLLELKVNHLEHLQLLSKVDFSKMNQTDHARLLRLQPAAQEALPAFQKLQIGRQDFSNYLQLISNNRLFVC